MYEDLRELLGLLAHAIHRPNDHPLSDLLAAVDNLERAPDPGPAAPPQPAPDPAPPAEPSEPDTPAVFPVAPAPFGTETAPEGASFPETPAAT